MKNKKGIVPLLALTLAGIIAGFILLGSFLFSGTFRWILIGIGIIIGGFWVLGQMVSSNVTGKKFLIVLAIFGIGMFFIFGSSVFQTFIGVTEFDAKVQGFGDRIVITATPNSEDIILDLSSSDINRKIEDEGYSVSKGTRLEIRTEEFKRVYPLIREQYESYKLMKEYDSGNYLDWSDFLLYGVWYSFTSPERQKLNQECKRRGYTNTVVSYMRPEAWAIDNLMCVERDQLIGNRGKTFGSAFDEFKLRITADGDTKYVTRNNQRINLKGGKIEVEFLGQLESPERIEQLPFDILWKGGEFKHLITDNSMTLQNEYYSNFQDCLRGVEINNPSGHRTCVNNYNRKIENNVLRNRNNDFAPSLIRNLNLITNGNNGRLEADLDSPPIPLLRIVVDGKFLGIEELKGKPKITSCIENIDTESGNDEELRGKLTIKNTGSQQGTFYISRDCDNSNIDVLLPSKIILNKGQSKTLDATITGASSQQGVTERANCKIEVKDRSGDGKDSCNFNVNIEFADVVCSPNELFCSEDKSQVLKCNSQGTDSNVIEYCSSDESCGMNDNGKITCLGGEQQGDEDEDDDEIDTCQTDADCNWYQKCALQKELDYKWYNYIGIGEPKELSYNECVVNEIYLYMGGGFLILILGLVSILAFKPKRRKTR